MINGSPRARLGLTLPVGLLPHPMLALADLPLIPLRAIVAEQQAQRAKALAVAVAVCPIPTVTSAAALTRAVADALDLMDSDAEVAITDLLAWGYLMCEDLPGDGTDATRVVVTEQGVATEQRRRDHVALVVAYGALSGSTGYGTSALALRDELMRVLDLLDRDAEQSVAALLRRGWLTRDVQDEHAPTPAVGTLLLTRQGVQRAERLIRHATDGHGVA